MIGNWRLLIAIPAVAALPLLGATAASAAPAHVQAPSAPDAMAIHAAQASPDTDGCESGYGIWEFGGYYLGQAGAKVDHAIETTTDNNYCWLFPVADTTGVIENESGYCLGFNSETGAVDLQDCGTNVSWQEWNIYVGTQGISILNEWANSHGYAPYMVGNGNGEDVTTAGSGSGLWHTCQPPGPC
jgi:hypothetical protein